MHADDFAACLPAVYLIEAVAAGLVLLSSLVVRRAHGATLGELFTTNFREIPPLRALIHFVHGMLWLAAVGLGLVALQHALAATGTSTAAHVPAALVLAAASAAAVAGARGAWHTMVVVPPHDAIRVSVDGVECVPGIDPARVATLGQERFPQMIAFGATAGLWVRGVLAIVFLTIGVIALLAPTSGAEGTDVEARVASLIGSCRDAVPVLPPAWGIVCALTGGMVTGGLLCSNPGYAFFRFPVALAIGAASAALTWGGAAGAGIDDASLSILAGALGLGWAARMIGDLVVAARFTRARAVSQPIATRIAAAVPGLASLRTRSDCRLPALDERELCQRITAGCRNAEEASLLVTRSFARFLLLARVETEHLVAAMLRVLTVGRFVTSACCGGTTRPLQCPVVPMWNESLFPLRAPTGFVDWLDPLLLGTMWDIVAICSRCGGSGRERCSGCGGSGRTTRTETYTVSVGGRSETRSRTVNESCSRCGGSGRVTCSICSGAGRVVHRQTLNTRWQRLLPTTTAPHVEVTDLVADAEERRYFHVPIVDDRRPLPLAALHDGIDSDLRERLSESFTRLAPDLPGMLESVERLHDGRVYRADFQVTGFHALRIGYTRLPGEVGWFFGARPEFYFPCLPLSWSMVGTIVFVVPFLLMTGVVAFALAANGIAAVLPLT
ncbi:MAG: hypothetical protein EBR86_04000 [Planctomycetia bacterium]|nr:hypothetical protein [Planctomycetia bacterium]